ALIGLIVASLCAGAFAQNIIVQQGDSLWSLARKHGTDVATLRELNGLQSDTLRVGQTLRLPGDGDAAPATTVTVRPGDTLFEIALAHGLTVEDLIAFNDLDGTTIHPGQELRLAAGDAAPEPLVVTIGFGDSLWVLARRYDSTIDAIAAANGIDRSATLRVGDRLTIPGRYAANDLDGTTIHPGQELRLAAGDAAPEPLVVTIGFGDSLWVLARRYDSTIDAIAAANGIDRSATLRVGDRLTIPGRYAANDLD